MSTTLPITTRTTVNDAIRLAPVTASIFGRYGIDACCGGGLPIEDAARRHGLDPAKLVAELRAALKEPE